jgi:hypothetical protein
MVAVMATPAATQVALNGATGENSYSWQVRDTADAGDYEPPDYVGDGTVHPAYPNTWMRLTRKMSVTNSVTNDLFTAYASSNQVDWVRLGSFDPTTAGAMTPFPRVVNVGMGTSTGYSDSYAPNTYFVTVMYENWGDYVAAPTLTATASNGTLTISWAPAGGTLESSPALGPAAVWTAVGTNNPANVPIAKSGDMFFRVSSQ